MLMATYNFCLSTLTVSMLLWDLYIVFQITLKCSIVAYSNGYIFHPQFYIDF